MTCMDLLSRTCPVPESTSNMEYQKLFTVHTPHSLKTLNCSSWYCDHHCHCCCLYTSVSYCYTTQKQKAWLILGDQLFHHFRGTVFVPLDDSLLYFMYSVAFLCCYFQTVYVQLRQNVPCSTQNGAVPLPAADQMACTVSNPKQCESWTEELDSIFLCNS